MSAEAAPTGHPPASAEQPVFDALDAHHLALVLAGRCPRCAERVTGGTALRARPCPHCAAPVAAAPETRALVQRTLAGRTALRLWVAVAVVAAATLIAGWLPLLASLLLAGGLVWIRLTIVRAAVLLLSPARRAVTLWTLRLGGAAYLALSVVAIEGLTLVPVLGVAAKAVITATQVAFAGWSARRYTAWQVTREIAGAPIGGWEHAAIAGFSALLLASVAALLFGLYWILTRLAFLAELLG